MADAAADHGFEEGLANPNPESASDNVILFIFTALLCGSLIKWLCSGQKRIPILSSLPHTALLFIFGMGLAAASNHLGNLGDAIKVAEMVHPHVILFILLPPLLLESSISIDWHVFFKESGQAALLALPGVFAATALTACAIRLVFTEYDWSWSLCLLLGSMLSATDPVAVVNALQQLGAPKRLSVVIEGESLLNDGSAFVLFLIFLDYSAGETFTAGELIEFFLRLSLGGLSWGLLCGFVVSFFISLNNDGVVETTVLLMGTYATFFIAEVYLEVSGVLATVALGLYFASRGKYSVTPEATHGMHTVLKQFGYFANTIIFVLAGVIVCR
jgi:sodium/hydrogen exchanger 10/11